MNRSHRLHRGAPTAGIGRRLCLAAMLTADVALALTACAAAPPGDATLQAPRRFRFEDTPEGARLVLDESILFEFGKVEFAGAAESVLDMLRPAFSKARGLIVVEGHADSVGNATFNQELSLRRAERVRDELIKRQIAPERVVARGLGSSKPRRWPELTEQDRRLNRRAEFLFPGETVATLGGRELEDLSESRLSTLGRLLGTPVPKAEGAEKK